MRLDNETLKKRLRYQGQQYGNGQAARGGSREPHMLEQAADRIDVLEREALYCKTDYDYILTITEDKDDLHDWLRTRSSRVGALLLGVETPNVDNSQRDAEWWALVMGAAAALEDAANCLRDPDAKKAAEGAAKHYRAEAKALTPNVELRGAEQASLAERPSPTPGSAD